VASTNFEKDDRVFGEGFSWERALKNGICSTPITIQIAIDQVFGPLALKI
jgi:hypothetical protein